MSDNKNKNENVLMRIAIYITLGYVLFVAAFRWDDLNKLSTMPLNEFGDFLAGAFSPIAFMWLVIGYLMQGRELKQNTQALNIQAEELKNAVEQYKDIAATSKA